MALLRMSHGDSDAMAPPGLTLLSQEFLLGFPLPAAGGRTRTARRETKMEICLEAAGGGIVCASIGVLLRQLVAARLAPTLRRGDCQAHRRGVAEEAAEEDTTVQELVGAALDMLFESRNRPPIARQV